MSGNLDDGGSMRNWSADRLLRQAARGGGDALDEFGRRYLPPIRRYLRAHCADLGIPRDLVRDFEQEILIKGIEFSVNRGRHLTLPWFLRVARTAMLDWKKKHRPGTLSSDVESKATGRDGDPAKYVERCDSVLNFLSWLNDEDRDLVEQVFIQGKTVAVAGDSLELTADAAHKRVQRALALIRESIAQHGDAKLPSMERPEVDIGRSRPVPPERGPK